MAEYANWSDCANIERWEKLHADLGYRESLVGGIKRSWARSVAYGIDYQTAKPQMAPASELAKARKVNRQLLVYSKSVVDMLMRQNRARDMGIMLFSSEGYLLFLVGDESFCHWAESNGVVEGTHWTEETIGTNIFSLGIKRREATILKGEENYSRGLTGANFYYVPILLESGKVLGGMAMVTRVDKHNEYLLGSIVTLSRAVELQFFWIGMFQIYGDISEGSGTVVVDQAGDEERISLISDEIFQILGIRKREVFGEHLDYLVPNIPENQGFWDIVSSKRKVLDETVKLLINDKSVVVNISASPFKEERFNMVGTVININSLNRINKLVSLYSGNFAHFTFDRVIGESDAMRFVMRRSEIAAHSPGSILLLGESGVGKDILAQSIHNSSSRRERPFVALNCAAFSKELIASELFGYEDGSFTGAKKGGSIGKFELANGGTLFLDEIGDMPPDLQAVLLRVLEEQSFRKVGGNTVVPVDVRIIAATNKNIYEQINQGTFREDLFYRLGVIRIRIPPLRERRDDIRVLAEHYIQVICGRVGKPPFELTEDAKEMLDNYHWPGNVRELQNLLEGIISTQEKPYIDAKAIQDYWGPSPSPQEEDKEPLDSALFEKREIEKALQMHRNKRTKAAAHLGMSRSTLYRRMKEFGLLDK